MSKETTIDDLARMVQKGFEETATRGDVSEINTRLDKMDTHLDHIENLLIRAHENRLEILEDKMRIIETAMGK